MDATTTAQFLGNLLNRAVDASTPLRLSSAQRARFLAWLHTQGQSVHDSAIKGEFTIASLAGQPLTANGTQVTALPQNRPLVESGARGIPSIGIDIQSVAELTSRINALDLKADASLHEMFTSRELSYAQARQDPLETLAGLWAAKEAMRKCLGGSEIPLAQIRALEILPDEHGRPCCAGFSLSISHSAGMAVAVAAAAHVNSGAEPEPTASATQVCTPPIAKDNSPGSGKVGKTMRVAGAVAILIMVVHFLVPFLR